MQNLKDFEMSTILQKKFHSLNKIRIKTLRNQLIKDSLHLLENAIIVFLI